MIIFLDSEKKVEFRAAKAIHKKRAAAFFDYLRDPSPEVYIISFDCEKNQPLPKVPDTAAYYARQLYLYNFTAVLGHSHSKLNSSNVKSFCWTENVYKKNANLIASCIFHLLKMKSEEIADLKCSTIRLMADGCGGQNKNSMMVAMCMLYFAKHAPKNVASIELIFPVTGHSFLPADRVFGRIEKQVKRHEMILNPVQLLDLIGTVGEVIDVASSVLVLDFQKAMRGVMKTTSTWPFQISKIKRVILRRSPSNQNLIEVKGELYYNLDTANFGSVMVRKQTALNLTPREIPIGNDVKKAKKLTSTIC